MSLACRTNCASGTTAVLRSTWSGIRCDAFVQSPLGVAHCARRPAPLILPESDGRNDEFAPAQRDSLLIGERVFFDGMTLVIMWQPAERPYRHRTASRFQDLGAVGEEMVRPAATPTCVFQSDRVGSGKSAISGNRYLPLSEAGAT